MKSNRYLLILFSGLLFASTSNAGKLKTFGTGFNAPTVTGKANVYSPATGEIVYDSSDSTFYGRNHSGSWQALGAGGGNPVVSGSSGQIMQTVAMTTACTSSPCSTGNYVQTGSWIQSITRGSAGNYTIDFTGAYSGAPVCFCQVTNTSGDKFCDSLSSPSTTTWSFGTIKADNLVRSDETFNIVCIGS